MAPPSTRIAKWWETESGRTLERMLVATAARAVFFAEISCMTGNLLQIHLETSPIKATK
jgi:hypothetical protein